MVEKQYLTDNPLSMPKSHWEKEDLWDQYLKDNLPAEETVKSEVDSSPADVESTGDATVSKMTPPPSLVSSPTTTTVNTEKTKKINPIGDVKVSKMIPQPPPTSIMATVKNKKKKATKKTSAKKTSVAKKATQKTSAKKSSVAKKTYKVKPRPSQGAGPPKPGTDYTKEEWATILAEFAALSKIKRKKGEPSLTVDRQTLSKYYNRSYHTISKKAQALGILDTSSPRQPKKKSSKSKISSNKMFKKNKSMPSPPPGAESPTTGLTKDEYRELLMLRKIVAQAVQDGKISVTDLISA